LTRDDEFDEDAEDEELEGNRLGLRISSLSGTSGTEEVRNEPDERQRAEDYYIIAAPWRQHFNHASPHHPKTNQMTYVDL
jgi:hypothetical protein